MTKPLMALALTSVATVALAAPAAKPAAAPAPASAAPGRAAAVAACERAAQDTLRDTRGASAVASFDSPLSALPGAADAAEVTLRGAGHVRTPNGSRPFSFSCTYDTRASAVVGVVIRDVGTPERATAVRSVEPDLSQISPAACESAAAGALKRRWPGVAQISFNADTRQLSQDAGGNASLRGQGSAAPSLREPATHFSYDCTVDPRNGRIVAVRIAD